MPRDPSTLRLLYTSISILFLAVAQHLVHSTIKPRSTTPNMAWRCSGRTNSELIANLFSGGLISSPRVRDAMSSVDRAHYCPSSPLAAYEDSPQSIGYAATISAPHMHASACESLLPFLPENKGARVLDIGSGSGYLTHVLANLVCGPDGKGDGKVVGIDHIQGLVDLSVQNMRRSEEGRRLLESGKVELVVGDGRKGYAEGGPYDAIHVGAAAKELHQNLVDQLKTPGRMFIPVEDGAAGGWGSQWIWVVDKDEHGKVTRKKDMGVRYVPLTDAPK
jgi:protein-L-isoaspartate(D-aspartate) O-methyltransferase